MKLFLKILFGCIFVFMIGRTIRTGLAIGIRAAWPAFAAPWGIATLFDAYSGFITFYVRVAYTERSAVAQVLWFLLIMSLDNLAVSFHVLLQLLRPKPEEQAASILARRPG
jgi:uncharacterized membrane protein YbjE (DUF340 family)